MVRTTEQIEADELLTAAIERLTRAYGYHPDGEVNGNWVVVVEQQVLDEESESGIEHSYALLMRGGKLSTMAVVGMLETASFDAKQQRQ
jgi:hypothetical protein